MITVRVCSLSQNSCCLPDQYLVVVVDPGADEAPHVREHGVGLPVSGQGRAARKKVAG